VPGTGNDIPGLRVSSWVPGTGNDIRGLRVSSWVPGTSKDIRLRLTGAAPGADTGSVSAHLDLIARIHAGFDAQTRLAASLSGRAVVVRGATAVELVALHDDLQRCGAHVVAELEHAQALIAGSVATQEQALEAVALRIAILRPADVALIADTRRRIARRSERAYGEAVDRALADARRLVAERDRRVATAFSADPAAPGGGMRIRGSDDRAA
jgi:hypothetical protein